jgi:hypothetical protein
MTGRQWQMMTTPRSSGPALRGNDAPQLRALLPPITPRAIFRALLGVLLFFCGIALGAWLIFRFRRHLQDATH